MRTASVTALRRLAIHAQGYTPRARTGTPREVEDTIRRLSCVQIDSITAVERSHRIVLGARVGTYPRQTVSRLLAEGRVFEFWAHQACLLPVEDWPLYRSWMTNDHPWRGDVLARYPELAEEVRAAIRERGPVTSREFEGEGSGGMWGWKPAKMVLEALWNSGEIVIAGRVNGFQRLYDLRERVLPRHVLDAPVPNEKTRMRELVRRAVPARGVLTESGVANHWDLRGGAARITPFADELVAAGALERVAVEDGGAPVLVPAGADLDPPRPSAAVLLSPFDNLVWDRRFLIRIFGFDHVMEIFKKAPERVYGYYVLPFLWRDRIVGRVDLKTERAAGTLLARAVHIEPGVRRSGALDDALDRALDRLRRIIGLERVQR
jgi:uncharacterized protein YcaQ